MVTTWNGRVLPVRKRIRADRHIDFRNLSVVRVPAVGGAVRSLLLPFPVILSLPAGIFGSYFFLQLAGLENNIYAQVALVMLIGLLGKNAILIIEMANQYRQSGLSVMEAAVKGAVSRLRPILMTSFAFICGLIPLLVATGAGALGNRSIGTAAAGGMFIGTFVGIF